MPRYVFTDEERRRGGLTASRRVVNKTCPECGKKFKYHAQYAGHLGLHAFARNNDIPFERAKVIFGLMGAAVTDPFPTNGAFSLGHKMLKKYREKET